jgi:hypothetical protein
MAQLKKRGIRKMLMVYFKIKFLDFNGVLFRW